MALRLARVLSQLQTALTQQDPHLLKPACTCIHIWYCCLSLPYTYTTSIGLAIHSISTQTLAGQNIHRCFPCADVPTTEEALTDRTRFLESTTSMFNRDRLPGLPGSSPRPPPRNDGYPQQPPPRQPPDTRMGDYDDRQQQGYGAPPPQQQRMPARGPPGGGARQLRPIKSPGGNAYAFGNLYVS